MMSFFWRLLQKKHATTIVSRPSPPTSFAALPGTGLTEREGKQGPSTAPAPLLYRFSYRSVPQLQELLGVEVAPFGGWASTEWVGVTALPGSKVPHCRPVPARPPSGPGPLVVALQMAGPGVCLTGQWAHLLAFGHWLGFASWWTLGLGEMEMAAIFNGAPSPSRSVPPLEGKRPLVHFPQPGLSDAQPSPNLAPTSFEQTQHLQNSPRPSLSSSTPLRTNWSAIAT